MREFAVDLSRERISLGSSSAAVNGVCRPKPPQDVIDSSLVPTALSVCQVAGLGGGDEMWNPSLLSDASKSS